MKSLSDSTPEDRQAGPGLRERKKARTKAAIQRHAVRLFREQGYDATTVEQIAEAAEVAPSTVFRYFPTKEDLVLTDDYDPIVWAAFRAQPPGLSLVQAWRGALRAAISQMSSEDFTVQRERDLLILAVPELWAASLNNITQMLDTIIRLSAERMGRTPDDPAVRNVAGALFGIMLALMFEWIGNPEMDMVKRLDDALGHLESGLPL
jgi:AcrR family transcriptional regulator